MEDDIIFYGIIHFDDDERWVLQKDEILDFDKLLVKYGVVENKNS